ncbi:sterol O-acyltransferase 1-like [Tribolium madens]|uniref:sterol O-acyltransferase 1-like n=1 Tax=Tribolium madens TaxID=41895 RepID=UPI001CF75B69|nr:sterol O-acyltransferase 1-like [Tribolium madens]
MSSSSNNNTKIKSKQFEKVFKIRNSPLTDRFENSEDIKTIYNLFAIILISLLTNTVIHDYSKTGQLHFGLRLIVRGFNKFGWVVAIWGVLNVLALALFSVFKFWAKIYLILQPKSQKFWNKIWVTTLILYYVLSLYSIQKGVDFMEFAPGSAAVLFLEEVRLLMKQHAFIRRNAPKVNQYKPHSDTKLILPTFQNFFYFLFAPTFVYRDEYPRTRTIRWGFVLYNLGEVLGIIWLLSLVVERFLVPPFEDICIRKYTLSEIVIPVVANSFPGILFMLCGFYSVLHSFQNAFAEMLRFGDRLFYKEWWTSRSLSEYYRTWNVIVHDWLFIHIYKDVYEIVVPRNKMAAKLAVFLISALVHEWILTHVLKLFLPIQFIEFFIAGAVLALFNILDLSVGNLFVWYLMVFGSGMQVNLYTLEFFARANCPLETNTTIDFLKPRFITCGCIL